MGSDFVDRFVVTEAGDTDSAIRNAVSLLRRNEDDEAPQANAVVNLETNVIEIVREMNEMPPNARGYLSSVKTLTHWINHLFARTPDTDEALDEALMNLKNAATISSKLNNNEIGDQLAKIEFYKNTVEEFLVRRSFEPIESLKELYTRDREIFPGYLDRPGLNMDTGYENVIDAKVYLVCLSYDTTCW